jgi:hypothetical protein
MNIAKKITDRRQRNQLLSQKALEACKHFVRADIADMAMLAPDVRTDTRVRTPVAAVCFHTSTHGPAAAGRC